MSQQFSEKELRQLIAENLRALYPKQFNFSREETGEIINSSSGHIANLESKMTPMLQSCPQGRKRIYQFPDIVDFLVKQRLLEQNRRGRKTKASRIEAKGGV